MKSNEFKIRIGELGKGELNSICDVKGVKVGHVTVDGEGVHTGVTAILPSQENPYLTPLTAAVYVLNGYGKSAGLMQMEELGELESPIILTNTLSVGSALDGLVRWNIEDLKRKGVDLKSFNGVVCECNDARHNDIANLQIRSEHVFQAISNAKESSLSFEQGSVGAGRGMTCHGLKGGIGSASRKIEISDRCYHIGALVLSNYGAMRDLTLDGKKIGKEIAEKIRNAKKEYGGSDDLNGQIYEEDVDKGSIIIVMACDVPLTSRQIKRVLKRGSIGLARVGSMMGNGSGDVLLGFTTANSYCREAFCRSGDPRDLKDQKRIWIHDSKLDIAFRAFAECVEEAVLQSMLHAQAIKKSETERVSYPDKEYARALMEFMGGRYEKRNTL